MAIRATARAAILVLGLGLAGAAQAQHLQPGMRTMIQQGGIEPGPLLGVILPGYGYAPGFGFAPDTRDFRPYRLPRPYAQAHYRRGEPFEHASRTGARHAQRWDGRRSRQARRSTRHHFAR